MTLLQSVLAEQIKGADAYRQERSSRLADQFPGEAGGGGYGHGSHQVGHDGYGGGNAGGNEDSQNDGRCDPLKNHPP